MGLGPSSGCKGANDATISHDSRTSFIATGPEALMADNDPEAAADSIMQRTRSAEQKASLSGAMCHCYCFCSNRIPMDEKFLFMMIDSSQELSYYL